jgi:hypothetical protein
MTKNNEYELKGEFPQPMCVMFMAEEIKPLRQSLNSDKIEFGLVKLKQPMFFIEENSWNTNNENKILILFSLYLQQKFTSLVQPLGATEKQIKRKWKGAGEFVREFDAEVFWVKKLKRDIMTQPTNLSSSESAFQTLIIKEKDSNMDIEKFSKIIAVAIPPLTLCAAIRLWVYYAHWDIPIFEYLSPSEILFSFVQPGLIFLLFVSLYIVFMLVFSAIVVLIATGQTTKQRSSGYRQ